ncbi:aldo/keto reductase family oxidoreductase [Tritrichomonas foetus]|uniref:Aldo/keto reductase family oxidoreductase n=1 Tax=Tritrichomonas foetus TaxID=1144522 RepID=A0A1J4KBI8_9EUKA|nr:aldo/keto reductase family oxidoreductase [Tritrichomonas foetus]|eukprot:OHT08587.1 aldo/keto reductase family oxidoreductase [Tritrichomonas foetus]
MEYTTLANGLKMPLSGFGVFQVPPDATCETAVLDAINAGYRLIDTAAAYKNEKEVGNAIKKSGVKREDLFIVTKCWIQDFGYESTKKAFETSLKNLGIEYLDLYLLHQPFGDYYGAWRACEELYESGKVKSIGVSNFYPDRLTDLCLNCRIKPMVNQVEIHPFFQQNDAIEVMKEFNIAPMAWGPLDEGRNNIFTHPVLSEIGKKYGKSCAQVALRWNEQRGVIIIPKSVHKERIIENFNIHDFKLSDEDNEAIAKLDLGHSEICDHRSPTFVKFILSFKIH